MTTDNAAADAARADIRELIVAKGHTVDNARAAVARLEAAFADGSLERTTSLDLSLADLMRALEQRDDQTTVLADAVAPEHLAVLVAAGHVLKRRRGAISQGNPGIATKAARVGRFSEADRQNIAGDAEIFHGAA